MGKRRRHTEAFKREAVRMMETRGERTIADIADSLAKRDIKVANESTVSALA
jgi:transposase-like protein